MGTPVSSLDKDTTFNSIAELKQACKAYAIDKWFEYKVVYSDKRRYTIECKVEECPWRLHSSSVGGSSLFRITKFEDTHTCFRLDHVGHAQADKNFIALSLHCRKAQRSTCSDRF
jgi:hypothetical protein